MNMREREREWKEKSHPEITQLAKDVKEALIKKCMHAKEARVRSG